MGTESSPAPSRRGDKRTLIINAAIEVFAEKGFLLAPVAEIARRAGVADGTIYRYFKNKDDLLLSIFEEKMDEMQVGLGEALATITDPVDQVRAFTRYHFQQVQQHRDVAAVLQVELRLSTKFLKEYRPVKLWAYLEVFAEIVRQGQAQGLFRRDMDPFIGMWAFFGAMDELAMQWVLARKQDRFPLEVAADQVADIFLRGMFTASPSAHPPAAPTQEEVK
ncbi:MAG: TetR/AcrR family transcriptional regulator [Myxococcota bacterium]